MEPVKFFDGTFDPNQAEKYALSFPDTQPRITEELNNG